MYDLEGRGIMRYRIALHAVVYGNHSPLVIRQSMYNPVGRCLTDRLTACRPAWSRFAAHAAAYNQLGVYSRLQSVAHRRVL